MENPRKIDIISALLVIVFLVAAILVFNNFNESRVRLEKDNVRVLERLVQRQSIKIQIMKMLLAKKQQENDGFQKTLLETRNNLEAISRNLPKPSAAVAPAEK